MKKTTLVLLIFISMHCLGKPIAEGYAALSVYDYFKAKSLFFKSLSKTPAEASYGLATIFYRNDNPFSNIDSAAKYIAIAQQRFKDTVSYAGFHINITAISQLANDISIKGLKKYTDINSVYSLNHYLVHFYFAGSDIKQSVYNSRDALLLSRFESFQRSDSMKLFLASYPESSLYKKAKRKFYDFQYAEIVPDNNSKQLRDFLSHYPENPNIAGAEIKLFELAKQRHVPDSLYSFIKNYSSNLTKEDAWKALYSSSVKDYSKQELSAFLTAYPDYPYNDLVLKEIELSQRIFIPFKNNKEKTGYIDTSGTWQIQPVYDDAQEFSEGFAAVCKNDTCFYINKEGRKAFGYFFDETENYKNGIAIAKQQSSYVLINRSGQIISKAYQDISALSDGLFVCKADNVYGAINLRGEIVIPFSYNKLGNFKNGYAYYLSTNYGLVDVSNQTLKAQWDWISDVDTNAIAIVKKAGKFGLLSVIGNLELPVQFDYIAPCKNSVYLVVKNNLYGFYNIKDLCYATDIAYDYDPAFEPDYYTNGKCFKLVQDEEVALVDANGRYSINYGTYSDLFFAKNDIIRVQKNNRYGFVDRKLKPVTAVEYDKATDFENNVALVTKGVNSMIVDKSGKIVFQVKNAELNRLSSNLCLIKQNQLLGIIDINGKQLLPTEYEEIEAVSDHLYRCLKNKEVFLFNSATGVVKKM